MDLDFSAEQKQVSAVFYEKLNDIDIYTEDNQKDHKFYDKFFGKILNGTNIKLYKTFQLGSKDDVVKSCKADNSTRKRLYIVDGDYGLQFEKYPDDLRDVNHLYILNAYCIENFVICKFALLRAIDIYTGGANSDEDVQKALDYEETLDYLTHLLVPLFKYYSSAQELNYGVKFDNIHTFLTNNSITVNENRITDKINMIVSWAKANGKYSELQKMIERRNRQFPETRETLLRIVSGKDFILPYITLAINCRLKKICGHKYHAQSNGWWKFQLVDNIELNKLDELKKALITA